MSSLEQWDYATGSQVYREEVSYTCVFKNYLSFFNRTDEEKQKSSDDLTAVSLKEPLIDEDYQLIDTPAATAAAHVEENPIRSSSPNNPEPKAEVSTAAPETNKDEVDDAALVPEQHVAPSTEPEVLDNAKLEPTAAEVEVNIVEVTAPKADEAVSEPNPPVLPVEPEAVAVDDTPEAVDETTEAGAEASETANQKKKKNKKKNKK